MTIERALRAVWRTAPGARSALNRRPHGVAKVLFG